MAQPNSSLMELHKCKWHQRKKQLSTHGLMLVLLPTIAVKITLCGSQKNIIHSYAKIHDINHLYKYNDSFNSRIIAVSPEPATLLPLSLPKMNDPEFRQNERLEIQSGQCTGVKKTWDQLLINRCPFFSTFLCNCVFTKYSPLKSAVDYRNVVLKLSCIFELLQFCVKE